MPAVLAILDTVSLPLDAGSASLPLETLPGRPEDADDATVSLALPLETLLCRPDAGEDVKVSRPLETLLCTPAEAEEELLHPFGKIEAVELELDSGRGSPPGTGEGAKPNKPSATFCMSAFQRRK